MSAAKPRTVRAVEREMEPGKVMAYSDAGYYCKDGDYASLIVPDVRCAHEDTGGEPYEGLEVCFDCGSWRWWEDLGLAQKIPTRWRKPRILRTARSRA